MEGKILYSADLEKVNNNLFKITHKNLYQNSLHFIFELLQNSEDAKAKNVKFILYRDSFKIIHDGKPFTIEDIKAICNVNESQKFGDSTKIGRFGIGFKSVYNFTDTPEIHSGEFDFRIINYTKASYCEKIDKNSNDTIIILPFNKIEEEYTKDQIFNKIANFLQNINLNSFIFLKNIRKIQYSVPDLNINGCYESLIEEESDFKRNIIITKNNESIEEFDIFSKKFIYNDKDNNENIIEKYSYVEIAFKIDEKNKKYRKLTSSPIYAFFPTNEESTLNFLIQGPFKTTIARESLKTEDDINYLIVNKIISLLGDVLFYLKENNKLDADFLNLLPFETPKNRNLVNFLDIWDFIDDNSLIPTNDNNFTNSNNLYFLSIATELKRLFDEKFLNDIFYNEKVYFIDEKIKESNEYKDLYDFLKEYFDIKVFDSRYLFPKLQNKENIFINKSNEDLLFFMDYVINTNAIYINNLIQNIYCIKLVNGKIIKPSGNEIFFDNEFIDKNEHNILDNYFIETCDDKDCDKEEKIKKRKDYFKRVIHIKEYTAKDNIENIINSYNYKDKNQNKTFILELAQKLIEENLVNYIDTLLKNKKIFLDKNDNLVDFEKIIVVSPYNNNYKNLEDYTIKYKLKFNFLSEIYNTSIFNQFLEKINNRNKYFKNKIEVKDILDQTKNNMTIESNKDLIKIIIENKIDIKNLENLILYDKHNKLQKLENIYLGIPYTNNEDFEYFYTKLDKTKSFLSKCYYDIKNIEIFIKNLQKYNYLQDDFIIDELTIDEDDERWNICRRKGYHITSSASACDYYLNKLQEALRSNDLKIMKIVWDYFIVNFENIKNKSNALFYPNYLQREKIEKTDSKIFALLKKEKWIPQNKNNKIYFKTPTESNREFLPKDFSFELDDMKEGLTKINFENINDIENSIKKLNEICERLPKEEVERWMATKRQETTKIEEDELEDTNLQSIKKKDKIHKYNILSLKEDIEENTYDNTITNIIQEELKEFYTDKNNIMICQMCHEELPFKRINGDYYFEIHKIGGHYFCLCPNCLAKYKEYIEDTKYLEILKKEIKNITYNIIDEFVKIIVKIENFEDIEFYINTEHLEKIKQNSFF